VTTGGEGRPSVGVLVVDDSEDLRDLISMVIRRHPGWHVAGTAADGREAITAARELQPDVVLLDIAMPVMDGLQALPIIRLEAPEAVVVIVSGYPAGVAARQALEAGAAAYLEKTDLVGRLIPRLEELLTPDCPLLS
jgi:YesN/AraC family two-component response regulator